MVPARTSDARARAPRYEIPNELLVASKTIGTSVAYTLHTENISRSGMLLIWNHKAPVPFIENTILELTIDPSTMVLSAPVSCLGKVVRKIVTNEAGEPETQFGVRIVQIDGTDLDKWETCIDDLAKKSIPVSAGQNPMIDEPSSKAKPRKAA
jgi:hypothetical protein